MDVLHSTRTGPHSTYQIHILQIKRKSQNQKFKIYLILFPNQQIIFTSKFPSFQTSYQSHSATCNIVKGVKENFPFQLSVVASL